MRIILSKNYNCKEIIKISQGDPGDFHAKLQRVIGKVHSGQDIYQAIGGEFQGLQPDQIEQIKDYVKGSLYQEV